MSLRRGHQAHSMQSKEHLYYLISPKNSSTDTITTYYRLVTWKTKRHALQVSSGVKTNPKPCDVRGIANALYSCSWKKFELRDSGEVEHTSRCRETQNPFDGPCQPDLKHEDCVTVWQARWISLKILKKKILQEKVSQVQFSIFYRIMGKVEKHWYCKWETSL